MTLETKVKITKIERVPRCLCFISIGNNKYRGSYMSARVLLN